MSINFNNLPTNNPGGTIPKGTYFLKIEKAEMKSPKPDANGKVTKPDYLNLVYAVKDSKGNVKGKLFDMITESDSDAIRYKLQRFITALAIPITGDFELKDLTKIVSGKELIGDITIQKDKSGQYPDKSVVDVFGGQIFYPISEAESIFGEGTAPAEFNASDADDAETTADGDIVY